MNEVIERVAETLYKNNGLRYIMTNHPIGDI